MGYIYNNVLWKSLEDILLMCDNCIHNLGKLVGRYFKFNLNIKGTKKYALIKDRMFNSNQNLHM